MAIKGKNMKNRCFFVVFWGIVLFFAVSVAVKCEAATGGGRDNFRPVELKNTENQADYIAIIPDNFAEALYPLLDYRAEEGFKVAMVTLSDIQKEFEIYGSGPEPIRSFVKYAYFHWKKPAPEYLLLVGDAPEQSATTTSDIQIPTGLYPSIYEQPGNDVKKWRGKKQIPKSEQEMIASDSVYADMDGDGLPEIAVGRLPADTPAEVTSMVTKILNYEKNPPAGRWKTRINFFASEGHFGSIDKLIEKIFKSMVRNNISPVFDLSMTYANPEMPYFYIPEKFNDKVIDRINEGSLVLNYIGHGTTAGLDDVYWKDKRYPILEAKDVAKLDTGGRSPFLIIIACLTGNYDAMGRESISELIMKKENGPVGIISASVVSQPTFNGILSKELATAIFKNKTERIGSAFSAAQIGIVKGEKDEDRKLLDRFTATLTKPEEIQRHMMEAVFMYNLIGDPATKIAYPAGNIEMTVPEIATAGDRITVTGKAEGVPEGEVEIALECPMVSTIYPILPIDNLAGDELNETIVKNYENANNKTAWSGKTELKNGEFKAEVMIPDWLPKMIYYVKAYAAGHGKDAAGAVQVKIRAKVESAK